MTYVGERAHILLKSRAKGRGRKVTPTTTAQSCSQAAERARPTRRRGYRGPCPRAAAPARANITLILLVSYFRDAPFGTQLNLTHHLPFVFEPVPNTSKIFPSSLRRPIQILLLVLFFETWCYMRWQVLFYVYYSSWYSLLKEQ